MTTADLSGLTRDELGNHRVTWLKTLGTEQTSHEKAEERLFVPLLRGLATGQPPEPERLARPCRLPGHSAGPP